MKILKNIFFLFLIFNATIIFSQNKRGALPSTQNLPPQTDFSWNNSCFGDTVCFINQTIRGNTYQWKITEDTAIGLLQLQEVKTLFTSTDTNICFYFWKIGTYTVSLVAYDNHYDTMKKIINIDTITTADFSFIHCSNAFANNCTCASTFLWDFGDGNHSTAISPTHQYADTGHYTITLIAYKGIISDTIIKQIYVDEESFANPAFTHTLSHDTLFVHVTSTTYAEQIYWSFGDGVDATGADTFHVYKDSAAYYQVGLTVINTCGPAFKSDSVQVLFIDTLPPLPTGLDFSSSILSIVPNPSSNGYVDAFFNAYTSNNYLVQVYNALGQLVFEEYFAFEFGINEFKISTSNFADGVYVMALQSGNSYIRKKFFVLNNP